MGSIASVGSIGSLASYVSAGSVQSGLSAFSTQASRSVGSFRADDGWLDSYADGRLPPYVAPACVAAIGLVGYLTWWRLRA